MVLMRWCHHDLRTLCSSCRLSQCASSGIMAQGKHSDQGERRALRERQAAAASACTRLAVVDEPARGVRSVLHPRDVHEAAARGAQRLLAQHARDQLAPPDEHLHARLFACVCVGGFGDRGWGVHMQGCVSRQEWCAQRTHTLAYSRRARAPGSRPGRGPLGPRPCTTRPCAGC